MLWHRQCGATGCLLVVHMYLLRLVHLHYSCWDHSLCFVMDISKRQPHCKRRQWLGTPENLPDQCRPLTRNHITTEMLLNMRHMPVVIFHRLIGLQVCISLSSAMRKQSICKLLHADLSGYVYFTWGKHYLISVL